MSIQPVGASGITAPFGADATAFLSPDALLAYCETRLQGLDTQIKTSFVQQQKANADSATLSDLAGSINACSTGGIAFTTEAGKNCAASTLVRAYEQAIDRVGRTTALGIKLIGEQKAFMAAAGGDVQAHYDHQSIWSGPQDDGPVKNIAATDIQAFVKNITDAQKDLNASGELTMINLQSLMSQRQTAVQLTTNLVQSLGDQMNKIAANIGH